MFRSETCSRLMQWLAPVLVMVLAFTLTTTLAVAQDPYAKPNNTWIEISGTVESVRADAFVLDYGDGVITVEMDDGDRDADGYKLVPGDVVNVSGMIDDDFYETTTIEAASVFVEKLGTTFYASPIDEEEISASYITPVIPSRLMVRGTVTAVNDDDFILNAGLRSVRVDVEEMPYDPLDDQGYQKIEAGDYVRVTGKMDYEFFEGRQLMADSVVVLID